MGKRFDMDQDVDIPDEGNFDSDESVGDVVPKEDGGTNDLDARAEAMAQAKFNDYMLGMALQDPEFAKFLNKKSGIDAKDPEPKKVDSSIQEKTKGKVDPMELVERKLSEIESKSNKAEADRVSAESWGKIVDIFEDDPDLNFYDDDFKKVLMQNAFQSYWVRSGGGKNLRVKDYITKEFKKNILSIEMAGVDKWRSRKKATSSMPSTPKKAFSGISDDEDFIPTGEDLKNGNLRNFTAKVLANLKKNKS